MDLKKVRFLFFVITTGLMVAAGGCKVSDKPYKPSKHMEYSRGTNTVKERRVNDIQYRNAYKYDTYGAKNRKHFKKRRKRIEKKKWFFGLF